MLSLYTKTISLAHGNSRPICPLSRVVFFDSLYMVENHKIDYKAILDWLDYEWKVGGHSGNYPRTKFKFSSIEGMSLYIKSTGIYYFHSASYFPT